MELKIREVDFPKIIEFNFDELKEEITSKAALYKNMVYTEESIKEAKADKAQLNKFITALENERKTVKKQCLKPYEDFEKKIKELVAIVDEPVQLIDSQVKTYEEKKKDKKLAKIQEYWENTEHPDWLKCNAIFDQKWLNATFSMKKVQEAIDGQLAQIETDLKTLEALPEFSFEAVETYKQTLDINRAISEGQRLADIQKRKLEAEAEEARLKAEAEAAQNMPESDMSEESPAGDKLCVEEKKTPEIEPQAERKWISFAANMTVEDALALKEFFTRRHIEFKAI